MSAREAPLPNPRVRVKIPYAYVEEKLRAQLDLQPGQYLILPVDRDHPFATRFHRCDN